MNLIEQLGLEKCKQILGGAPTGATDFVLWTGKIRYLNSEINEIYSESSREWFSANIMVLSLMTRLADLRTAIANHATLTNKGSTYKAQTIDTIYLCKIADELILNDSCVITVTFTGSTSVVLIGSSKQMVINRVGGVINLLFNNESYSLKKDQIEAALRPYLGSRTLIQAFG